MELYSIFWIKQGIQRTIMRIVGNKNRNRKKYVRIEKNYKYNLILIKTIGKEIESRVYLRIKNLILY